MSFDPSKDPFPQFPKSVWLSETEMPTYPKLANDIEADVAVVGAGITGMTTAYLLASKGFKVVLVDAGKIANGTTGHTTAKITAQHDLVYDEFISHFGEEKSRLYYEANRDALNFIKKLVVEQAIPCQFKEEDAYIYTIEEANVAKIEAESKAYEKLGIPGGYLAQPPLPFQTQAAIVMKNQAQFDPIPFLKHIAQAFIQLGGQIFEQTTVVGVDKGTPATVKTSEGFRITCNFVVSSSHFPFNDRNGFYFARLHAEKSYALAAKTEISLAGGMYINADTPARSLRTVMVNGEELLLIGGESHKTGQGICTFQYYEALRQFGVAQFNLQEVRYHWSAQDLLTLDKLPYIGREVSDESNILIATGFKKWGMTTSVAAAILNTALIAGEKSPYEELFSPSRFHADPMIKTFIMSNANIAKHLIAGKFDIVHREAEELQNDEGAVVRVNGKRAGAYRDTSGELHVVDTTCTHMGCEVEWNEAERSWDCPCHGSRFSYTGTVIEGPAKQPLTQVDVRGEQKK
ncbi:FAD-dependent oxidoreductase [Paenibacillus sp. CGMCC 1.16610]|uniref:FAD-dependent oxidoreductase n=1 Tax=Paenibacillus anseongense TaxID=2682845 RepID=A0ABW9U8I7_9BACL|nr:MULTISPECIES: FAD-dependent oxidoreductase [Paenibacillus]MBA2940927.1 FAD-dependent oxidoreductase [Paenibacillus sp. CGMCC 1.16610]MVQ34110.1 FAD-dependent oxidoreductase [Paenibacillus anseongense]